MPWYANFGAYVDHCHQPCGTMTKETFVIISIDKYSNGEVLASWVSFSPFGAAGLVSSTRIRCQVSNLLVLLSSLHCRINSWGFLVIWKPYLGLLTFHRQRLASLSGHSIFFSYWIKAVDAWRQPYRECKLSILSRWIHQLHCRIYSSGLDYVESFFIKVINLRLPIITESDCPKVHPTYPKWPYFDILQLYVVNRFTI